MGGTISVTSTAGSGSVFSFTLPLITADAPAFGHEGLKSKRVLVIAESPSVREAISVVCVRAGMQVTDLPIWQHNLHDLLVDGSAFDLVVTDSGLLVDALGTRWVEEPTLPTLVIAPYGKPLDALPDQFRQIYKPINSNQLLGFSEELLGLAREDEALTDTVALPPPACLLLVEDNPVNRKIATRMLEKLGMRITVAEEGQAALDLLANGSFDLVLMDCQMPVLDGYSATEQIRLKEKGTDQHQIIIALTANSESEYRQRCINAGMDDYLAKPYKKEALAKILNHWLTPASKATLLRVP